MTARLKLSTDQRSLMQELLRSHPKPVTVTHRSPTGCSLVRKGLATKRLARLCGKRGEQLADMELTPLGLAWFTEKERATAKEPTTP